MHIAPETRSYLVVYVYFLGSHLFPIFRHQWYQWSSFSNRRGVAFQGCHRKPQAAVANLRVWQSTVAGGGASENRMWPPGEFAAAMVEWWLNGILSPKIQWKKNLCFTCTYLHEMIIMIHPPDWMCFWYYHSWDRVKNTQYTNYTIGIPWVLISLDPFQNRNISKLKVQIPGFQLNMGPVALPLGSRPLSHQVFGRWWSDPRHQMGWM